MTTGGSEAPAVRVDFKVPAYTMAERRRVAGELARLGQGAETRRWVRDCIVLRRQARAQTVTLLYAAQDREHNSARVLKEALEDGLPES